MDRRSLIYFIENPDFEGLPHGAKLSTVVVTASWSEANSSPGVAQKPVMKLARVFAGIGNPFSAANRVASELKAL
jgi:hypothetical protein